MIKKKIAWFSLLLFILYFCLSGCSKPIYIPDYSHHLRGDERSYQTILANPSKVKANKPVIALQEKAFPIIVTSLTDLEKNEFGDYDFRYKDLSSHNLSILDYSHFNFSTNTVWPEILPEGFDPQNTLEEGKNPGLGIRDLHAQGIDGRGIGIAIIDFALLLEHREYADRIMYYERIHCNDTFTSMHGAAVASLVAGETTGIAPKSKLYYFAVTNGHFDETAFTYDCSILADAIYRIMEVNRFLSDEEKIRVISISVGYSSLQEGYDSLQEAISQASKENIFVITTSTQEYYKNLYIRGLSRDLSANPDMISSYSYATWINEQYIMADSTTANKYLMFPVGNRTYASFIGADDYEINCTGGLSWAVPWCAGFYALCCQVKPDITPEEFIDIAYETAHLMEIEIGEKMYPFGKSISPEEVINVLLGNDLSTPLD